MDKWHLGYCIKEITDAATGSELRQCLEDFRELYHLTHAVLHVTDVPGIPQTQLPLILTYPREWVDTYMTQNYLEIDPVVRTEHRCCLSFDWSSLDLKSPSSARFFQEAETFGIGRRGLTTNVRGPGGERSLFTVTSNLDEAQWVELRESAKTDFHVFAINLHEKVMTLSGLRERNRITRLSRRETQCLELLARGFVPKQIVTSLGISESAVRLYLGSGRRKLQVATMNQAIAKAATLELIRC